jgi:hypothetical protein
MRMANCCATPAADAVPQPCETWPQVYKLFNLVPFHWDNIGWLALAHQLPTMLVVCIVCSFGVSMDIMAVQARPPSPHIPALCCHHALWHVAASRSLSIPVGKVHCLSGSCRRMA